MPRKPKKPKIFISYASDDREKVLEIYEFFLQNGADPWIDLEELLPGQDWQIEIEKAIKESDYFIACLSSHSVTKTGFVQKELKTAFDVLDLHPDGKIYLIPIRLDKCPVPDRMKKKQWVDWSEGTTKKRLLKSLKLELPESTVAEKPSAPSIIIPKQMEEITIELPSLPKNAKPLVMVKIPAGEFMMGSPDNEKDRWDAEGPQHKVNIPNEFYIGKYPITQAQWSVIMGENPSYFENKPNHPVETISWDDCHNYLEKLNELNQGIFRLPSEAEWEYACRAKTNTRFYWGEDPDYYMIKENAWFDENNVPYGTKEIGLKSPNPWGLYDMSGNVWEWCEDKYYNNSGTARVLRGGGWRGGAGDYRSAARGRLDPGGRNSLIGLRVIFSRT